MVKYYHGIIFHVDFNILMLHLDCSRVLPHIFIDQELHRAVSRKTSALTVFCQIKMTLLSCCVKKNKEPCLVCFHCQPSPSIIVCVKVDFSQWMWFVCLCGLGFRGAHGAAAAPQLQEWGAGGRGAEASESAPKSPGRAGPGREHPEDAGRSWGTRLDTWHHLIWDLVKRSHV